MRPLRFTSTIEQTTLQTGEFHDLFLHLCGQFTSRFQNDSSDSLLFVCLTIFSSLELQKVFQWKQEWKCFSSTSSRLNNQLIFFIRKQRKSGCLNGEQFIHTFALQSLDHRLWKIVDAILEVKAIFCNTLRCISFKINLSIGWFTIIFVEPREVSHACGVKEICLDNCWLH